MHRFESDNILKCQLRAGVRTCQKKFVKSVGIFHVGKYLCSETCFSDDDDIKKFTEMEENSAKLLAEEGAGEDSDDSTKDIDL